MRYYACSIEIELSVYVNEPSLIENAFVKIKRCPFV